MRASKDERPGSSFETAALRPPQDEGDGSSYVSMQAAERVDQSQNRKRHTDQPQQQVTSHEHASFTQVELRFNSGKRGFVPDGKKLTDRPRRRRQLFGKDRRPCESRDP